VEVYTTENEQVDVLRRFFAENGKALAVGVVLGIIALGGWRYWQSHQDKAMAEASASFQQATNAMAAGDGKTQNISELEKFAQSNNNNYGVFAALQLADHFVDAKDFANADKQLTQALSQTKDENLLSLVNFRLARVQIQENQLDQALKTLGLRSAFWKSLTVIIPSRWNCASTTSAFSTRFSCIFCNTTSRASPSLTVTRRSFGVITAVTGCSKSVTKRTSRPVMIPTSSLPSVTTG